MRVRSCIAVILVLVGSQPVYAWPSSNKASGQDLTRPCDSLAEWFGTFGRPRLLAAFCQIADGGDPVPGGEPPPWGGFRLRSPNEEVETDAIDPSPFPPENGDGSFATDRPRRSGGTRAP